MKNKKIFVFLIVTLLFILQISGCGSKAAKGDGSSSGSGEKILFLIRDGSDSFSANLGKQATAYAPTGGVNLTVADSKNSVEAQVAQIRDAVGKGYSAIICNPVDASTAEQIIAAAGKLPVVFVNTPPADKCLKAGKCIYVGSKESDAGAFQVEYMLKNTTKKELNIVLLEGPLNHSGARERSAAVKNGFEDAGIKANFIFDDYGDWSSNAGYNMLNSCLRSDQKIDFIVANNDSMALGAVSLCKKKGLTVPILGVDATADGCAAIKDGSMAFTVYQSAKGQAKSAVDAAKSLGSGKDIKSLEFADKEGTHIWVPFEKVDKSNVTKYM